MLTRIDAATQLPRTQFVIEPAGTHKFAYTKLAPETGEELWRWPLEEPQNKTAVSAVGQLLDVSI